jgi:hypothetical protein
MRQPAALQVVHHQHNPAFPTQRYQALCFSNAPVLGPGVGVHHVKTCPPEKGGLHFITQDGDTFGVHRCQ